jgi:chemotaxis protein MotB
MSSINEGRYRVLSGALSTAFSPGEGTINGGLSARPQGPVVAPSNASQSGIEAKTPEVPKEGEATKPPPAPAEPPIDPAERAELARTSERVQRMQQLAAKMDENLQKLVRDGQVNVTRGARGIAIEINAAVLFDPAHAELKPASFEALRSLAQVLTGFVEPLQIEGHSDDTPISTREFKSNWELSAARAASVGRFLIDQGIAPGRIGIAGYAEYRPLVGNSNAETRARNRRVTLLILSADDTRPKEGGTAPDAGPEAAAPAPP